MTDLEIIKELEKQLGFPLKQIKPKKIYDEERQVFVKRGIINGYVLDEQGKVIYLSLDHISGESFDNQFITKLKQLELISLRGGICKKMDFLSSIENLEKIDLSNCQITDYSFLEGLKSLNSLALRNNQITDISFLKDLKLLISLDLSSNKITDISFLKDLKSLNSLNLSYNEITDISFLRDLKNLISLNLSFNKITDISFLKDLKSLISLILSSNQITDISFLKDIKSLNTLHLQSNPIKILPDWITDFKIAIKWNKETWQSDAISFYDNPLESPPVEIVKKGKKAIRNYFEQIKKEKEQYLFETKLLIIGEGGAGKTSFSVKMKDENAQLPKDEDTTLGINVTKWDFEINHPLRGKQQMYANIWDFGGQKLYQGTHQIFFSPKSFYVLLDDSREEKMDFAFWLNTVEQIAGEESRLLIVTNKKHEHVPQIDKNGLRERFGDLITNFETVDLLNDISKIVTLQCDLKHYLQKLPGIGDPLPASWVNIRKELYDIEEDYISYNRFVDICRKHQTDITKLNFLSDYYNRVGVFTHYYNDKLLRNRVFLNSNWLLNVVYEVLNHKLVKDKTGRITEDDLKQIWIKDELFTETCYLSRLMHRFGMMYEVPGKDMYVVPAHLPMEQPYKSWQYENDKELLQFAYEFDKYMPRGIMPRLIVALHRLIKDQKLVWNKGVNICYENTHAEVKETYEKTNKFLIRISGIQKKELLGIIINEFDKLLEPYKKLHYEKLVPCICSKCNNQISQNFFEYSDLKRRKENGKLQIECKISYEDVSVERLLDGIDSKMEKEKMEKILVIPEIQITMSTKELEGYKEILETLIEKKLFLEKELITAYDSEKKFALNKQIQELEPQIIKLKIKFDGVVVLSGKEEKYKNPEIENIKNKLEELHKDIKNIHYEVTVIQKMIDEGFNKLSPEQKEANHLIISDIEKQNQQEQKQILNELLGYVKALKSDSELEKAKKIADNDRVEMTQKLKFVIPLLFANYEMEFSTKAKVLRSWQEFKELFSKKKE